MRRVRTLSVDWFRAGHARSGVSRAWSLLFALVLVAVATVPGSRAGDDRGLLVGLFGTPDRGRAATSKPAELKARLTASYPGAFAFDGNMLVFNSGARLAWDDRRSKSADELLDDADVEDMFHWPYPPASAGEGAPPRDHDPGRVRSDAFFRALYGANETDARKTLRAVPWFGGTTMNVTRRFGVDRALERVRADLLAQPDLARYLSPPAGSFYWRNVARTGRLSVHSFGAAVDLNTTFADYWLWRRPPAGQPIAYRNRIPLGVVAAFERHCFIWGGRWYHHDTMHFEYRPELLPGCRRGTD